jgi:hypothetical protein
MADFEGLPSSASAAEVAAGSGRGFVRADRFDAALLGRLGTVSATAAEIVAGTRTDRVPTVASLAQARHDLPAFVAMGAATAAVGVQTWQQKPLDIGSGFNAGTGRFTAARAGIHVFHASVLMAPIGAAAQVITIRRNGTKPYGNATFANATGVYAQIATSVIYDLAVNDYVDLYSDTALFQGTEFSVFIGWMR